MERLKTAVENANPALVATSLKRLSDENATLSILITLHEQTIHEAYKNNVHAEYRINRAYEQLGIKRVKE